MEFQIALGGVCFRIQCEYPTVKASFSDFLVEERAFAVPIVLDKNDLISEWRKYSLYDGKDDSVQRIGLAPILERLAITRKAMEHLLSDSAILMHGAVVCDGKSAYMFTAPSGTGKSTRARLFVDHHPGSFILNGDKPIVRVENDRVMACGSPWKGSENLGVNAESPLKAIFLLERAEQTEIVPVSLSEAFGFLLKQTFMPADGNGVLKTIQVLKSFENKVRLFRFRSPATVEAVDAAYHAANEP